MDLVKNIMEFSKSNPSVVVFVVFALAVVFLVARKSIFKFFSKTTPGIHGKSKNPTQNNASETKGDLEQFRDKVTNNYGIQDTKNLEAKIDNLTRLQEQALADKQANPEKALADRQAVDKDVRNNLKAIEAYIPAYNTKDALEKLDNNDRSGAIDIFTALEKQSNRLSAECAFNLGKIAFDDIRWQEALGHFERALELEPENEDYIDKVADLNRHMGRFEQALPLRLKLASITEAKYPKDHLSQAKSYNNLAVLYAKLENSEEALLLFLKAMQICENTYLERDHPYLAISYNNLAGLYQKHGKHYNALPLYLKAISIQERLYSDKNHAELATSYNNLAMLYYRLGMNEEARLISLKAIVIREKIYPKLNHPDVATSYNNLALIYDTLGKVSDAENFYKKAVLILSISLSKNHPDRIYMIENYSLFLKTQGRENEAAILLKEHGL